MTKKLTKEGWTVRKSKVDGGCYEVYGTTPEGDRVEAYFHPVTLEKLYVGRRGEVLFRKAGLLSCTASIVIDKTGVALKRGSGPRGPNAALLSARRRLHDYQ